MDCVEGSNSSTLERRYGGPPARDAALVIQRAFRRYSMVKEFHRIKTERRLSKRIPSSVSPVEAHGSCDFCQDLLQSREDLKNDEEEEDDVSRLHSSGCTDVAEVEVEVDQNSYLSSGSSAANFSPVRHIARYTSAGSILQSPPSRYMSPNNGQNGHSSHRVIQFDNNDLHQKMSPYQTENNHIRQGKHIIPSLCSNQSPTRMLNSSGCANNGSKDFIVINEYSSSTSSLGCYTHPMASASNLLNTSNPPKSRSYGNEHSMVTGNDSEIIRKRLYRVGLNLFNKKPEVGIAYLVKKKFLDGSAHAVARFLISRKGLSKQMIGEYMTNLQSPFSMACLEHFSNEIDLTGMPIDEALRRYQSFLRMPGEAQKIERVMEAYSHRYAACNPQLTSKFRQGADTVFVIAFAIIMLNTDLHTPHLRHDRRMKLEDFIKNLRGIDDGSDVPRDLLVGIYERIKQIELKTGSDHVTQVMKVQQTIVGKKPNLAVPHRRLVCYCRLYEVTDLNKKDKAGSHQREVFLFNDVLVITKIFHKKRNSVTYSYRQSYNLAGITLLLFENHYYEFGLSLRRGDSVLINFNARNASDRAKFTEDLKEAIAESDEMARIENLSKENRDSGVDVARMKRFSNSLLDINEQCKPVRRGSCGSLDSGMSVSFHSDETVSKQNAQALAQENNRICA